MSQYDLNFLFYGGGRRRVKFIRIRKLQTEGIPCKSCPQAQRFVSVRGYIYTGDYVCVVPKKFSQSNLKLD